MGQRNTVFYGLLGIVFFHLKAVKGLPSMETVTARGWDTAHLGPGWKKKFNPFSPQSSCFRASHFHLTSSVCISLSPCCISNDVVVLMILVPLKEAEIQQRRRAVCIYKDYFTLLRLACGSG